MVISYSVTIALNSIGAIQVLRNAVGVLDFPKKRNKGINITRGCVIFPGKSVTEHLNGTICSHCRCIILSGYGCY